jgi:serine/threonine protein kinase
MFPKMAYTIMDTLAALHERRIYHRDVKPSNIMLRDGNTILVDYGLACGLNDPAGCGPIKDAPLRYPPLVDDPGNEEYLWKNDVFGAALSLLMFVQDTSQPVHESIEGEVEANKRTSPPSFLEVLTRIIRSVGFQEAWFITALRLETSAKELRDKLDRRVAS